MDVNERREMVRAANEAGVRLDGGGDDRPPVYEEDGIVVYRASSVGKLCDRALWLARTGVPTSPTPLVLADAYVTSANNEQLAIDLFVDEYMIDVTDQQMRVEVPVPGTDAVIRGHLDGLGHDKVMERTGVVEVKCINETSWGARGVDLYAGWREQVMLGMRGAETDLCWMVWGKKVDGVVDDVSYSVVEYDRRVVAAVFDKVRRVERAVREGQALVCPEETWGCPYWQLHEDGGDEEVVADTEIAEIAADVDRLAMEQKVLKDEWSKRRDELARLVEERDVGGRLVGGGGWPTFRVTIVTPTRSGWDEEALSRDGVELDKYKVKTEGSPYVKVTRQRDDKEME